MLSDWLQWNSLRGRLMPQLSAAPTTADATLHRPAPLPHAPSSATACLRLGLLLSVINMAFKAKSLLDFPHVVAALSGGKCPSSSSSSSISSQGLRRRVRGQGARVTEQMS